MSWNPQIDTAEWIDRDLAFDVATEAGTIRYVIRSDCLKDVAQRTCGEVLLHNLPHLREPLMKLALAADPDKIIVYGPKVPAVIR